MIFSEDDSDVTGDDFESDGYLSKVVEYTNIWLKMLFINFFLVLYSVSCD